MTVEELTGKMREADLEVAEATSDVSRTEFELQTRKAVVAMSVLDAKVPDGKGGMKDAYSNETARAEKIAESIGSDGPYKTALEARDAAKRRLIIAKSEASIARVMVSATLGLTQLPD